MSNRVYVPGYGYVDSAGPGTRGEVKNTDRFRTPSGGTRVDTGQGTTKVVYSNPGAKPQFDPVLPSTTESTGTGSGKRSSMGGAFGVDSGDPIVSIPNLNWYYSSADVYGSQDPSDPRSTLNQGVLGNPNDPGATPMWNFGLNVTDAEAAFDDDSLVPPGMREALKAAAQRIHPLKQGRTLWEEAVAASALASKRGEYVTPYAILRSRYFEGDAAAGASDSPRGSGSSGYSGGGGYGGGGYGGGGGGGSVSLTNPTSARGLLMQTMQGVLGRNPTEQEYNQFIKALTQAEMGAPRTVDVEGDLAVQSGGVDPGMVAMEYVQGLEEFDSAEGQRAFGAFMQVLGA